MKIKSALLSLLLVGASSANAAVLITNGDFESGNLNGWTVSGTVDLATVPWFGGGTTPRNGNYFAAFNAGNMTPNGILSQTFSTIADTTYSVTFDYGTNNGSIQRIIADVLGNNGSSLLNSLVATENNGSGAALQDFTFSFVADGNVATLRFRDDPTNFSNIRDGLIDNVSVSAAVPEPATVALMGLGFLGFAASRRKQAKKETV